MWGCSPYEFIWEEGRVGRRTGAGVGRQGRTPVTPPGTEVTSVRDNGNSRNRTGGVVGVVECPGEPYPSRSVGLLHGRYDLGLRLRRYLETRLRECNERKTVLKTTPRREPIGDSQTDLSSSPSSSVETSVRKLVSCRRGPGPGGERTGSKVSRDGFSEGSRRTETTVLGSGRSKEVEWALSHTD